TSGVLFRFLPQGQCGFPACDAVHLIQIVRATGFGPHGGFGYLTAAEEGLPGADKLDAWTTPAHVHSAIDPQKRKPYITIGAPYISSKPGRVGATMDTAQVFDAPHMYDDTQIR